MRAKKKFQTGRVKEEPLKGRDRSTTQDAIIFLRHAERSVIDRLKSGALRRMDAAHLAAMQALAVLQGEGV